MNIRSKLKKKYYILIRDDNEKLIYFCSIIVVLFVLLFYMMLYVAENAFGMPHMKCGFYSVFHIPCPGCGGTRAIVNLLHGRVWTAIRYNAFAVYCSVVYIIYFATNTLQLFMGKVIPAIQFKERYLYFGLVILVIQYVYKLVRFKVTGMLL